MGQLDFSCPDPRLERRPGGIGALRGRRQLGAEPAQGRLGGFLLFHQLQFPVLLLAQLELQPLNLVI
ncbi:MAG: hypothetical protein DLM66_07320 [Candidatus Dormiibacter spiritus]|nr:MAG: hypothetical protein DLM66_07320 [Candidatus Dormibacteraeota bacterium]